MTRSSRSLEFVVECKKEKQCKIPLLSSSSSVDDDVNTSENERSITTTLQQFDHSSDIQNEIDGWSDKWKRQNPEHRISCCQFHTMVMAADIKHTRYDFPPDPEFSYFRLGAMLTMAIFSCLSPAIMICDLGLEDDECAVPVTMKTLFLYTFLIIMHTLYSFYREGPMSSFDRRIKFSSFIVGKNSNAVCLSILQKGEVLEKIFSETKLSISCYQRVIDILTNRQSNSNHNNDDWKLAPFHNKLGRTFHKAEMYNEAIGPLIESVRLYKEGFQKYEAGVTFGLNMVQVQRKLPMSMHHVGFTLEQLAQYNEAAKYHREAVSFFRSQSEWEKTIDAAQGFKHLGQALSLAGDTEEALEAFRSSALLYRLNFSDPGNKEGSEIVGSIALGRIHVALGNILLEEKKDTTSALQEYELAESEYRHSGLVDTSTELGVLLQKIDEIKICDAV